MVGCMGLQVLQVDRFVGSVLLGFVGGFTEGSVGCMLATKTSGCLT